MGLRIQCIIGQSLTGQKADSDEFYQLSFSLIFNPTVLSKEDISNAWSCDYNSLEEWVAKIKDTAGYNKMKNADYRAYELFLDET